MHLGIFKTFFIVVNAVVLFIYTLLRLLFYEFPVEWAQEGWIVCKLACIGTGFALCISILLLLSDAIDFFLIRKRPVDTVHSSIPLAAA